MPLSSRRWIQALGYLLLLVVFMAEICVASADGLFDFQMKLAKGGNPEAEFKIGEMYETGFGTTKNMKLAKEWIMKAAAQGHEMAKFKLLYWDMKKNGITKSNKAQYKDLVAKANSENPGAQYYLGKIYADGAGVPMNREKALDLYNKATLQGNVEAERDASQLRDKIRREDLARKAEEQKQQEALKAKHEEELRKQRAAARLAAQKKAAAASKQAEAKPKPAPAAKKSDNVPQQAKTAAQQAAEQKALEAKRQALLKQREQKEAKRKDEFDSDPCRGKSARFLSTCH
jgi:flagellar biosynthesis GTPase FlhF